MHCAIRLQVVCDGSGLGSAWLLESISVTAKSSGATTWFYAGRWLGRAAGLEAVLDGSDVDVRGQLVTYKVGFAAVSAATVTECLSDVENSHLAQVILPGWWDVNNACTRPSS
jgi:hypothetical protein